MTGILLIDKAPDWTSHDAVSKCRGLLRERRIGHAGTLDPMATGLLVLLCGRATRAAGYAEATEKEYLASFRPGLVTDTQDSTGRVLRESGEIPTEEAFLSVLPRFTGPIEQVPPMYSAIKIRGQKLYDIARRGGEVEREPRSITIHELSFLGRDGRDFLLRVRCSRGTYIRSLCHDIGEALGCGGCMSALRRTACGPFRVEDACPVEEASEGRLLPLEQLFSDRPALTLSSRAEERCRCGGSFPLDVPDGEYRFLGQDGSFLALGRVSAAEGRSIKSFFEVS